MRAPVYAVAALAVFLALSIYFFGHKPSYSLQELQARCEDTAPENNRKRVRACHAILAKQGLEHWYYGAINSQVCHALVVAARWNKAVHACTKGNDPYPQRSNYVNRAAAYLMLGQKDKAWADLVQAQIVGPPAQQ